MEPLYTGRSFHAFEDGETFLSPARTVTEAHIAAFAGLSGDFNPLHMDEEYAKAGPHGGRIAHGMLTLSVAAGLLNRYVDGTCIALLDVNARLIKVVRPGDTLRIRVTISEKRLSSKGTSGVISFAVDALNQREEVVLSGVWKMLLQV